MSINVIARAGHNDLAVVYVAEFSSGKRIEFVESLQPPRPREEKWVVIVSTMFGCPIGCTICDAGGGYQGNLTAEEMLAQIEWVVRARFGGARVPSTMFKIQFARMGEPSLNPAVLDVLERLPSVIDAPGLLPSLSSVAPNGSDAFFEKLIAIVDRRYRGRFQLQFSLHTTNPELRRKIVPVRGWSFEKIAAYGRRFHQPGDRKIGLNFAAAQHMPIDADVMREYFSPDVFMIKLTPLNPTARAARSGLTSAIDPVNAAHPSMQPLRAAGYDVIVSVGEAEENKIGSNCGQYLETLAAHGSADGAYLYPIERV